MSQPWGWFAVEGGAGFEPAQDQLRAERALAAARVLLGTTFLLGAYIDTPALSAGPSAGWSPFAGYAAVAALVLMALSLLPRAALRAAPAVHVGDVTWAVAVAFLLPDRASAFFVYFVFALVAAGVRWGGAATFVSGAATVLAVAVGAFVGVAGGTPADTTRWLHRAVDLFILVVALSVILSHLRRTRLDRAFLGRVVGDVARAPGLSRALRAVLANCTHHFGATVGLVVMQDIGRGHLFVCRGSDRPHPAAPDSPAAARSPGAHARFPFPEPVGPSAPAKRGEPVLAQRPANEAALFLFDVPAPAVAWYVQRDAGGRGARGWSVRRGSVARVGRFEARAALPLIARTGATSLVGADAEVRGEWRARLLLFDTSRPTAVQLRLLHSTVSAVAPVLRRQYLQRRLRSRISAMERTRLASELHDELLQSMIGVEMQLEVLRRHTSATVATLEPLVRGVRDLMRQSVADARDVMQRLRPSPVTGRQVLKLIAEYADRLRDESGLDVRLLTSVTDLDCPPRTCAQLARIIQEALANARKHSGARTVTVNLSQGQDVYRMIVEDDGRGLGFEGRRTLEQLEASESGPSVIKERVRAIGGQLTIDSEPGKLTRVIVEWPRATHV